MKTLKVLRSGPIFVSLFFMFVLSGCKSDNLEGYLVVPETPVSAPAIPPKPNYIITPPEFVDIAYGFNNSFSGNPILTLAAPSAVEDGDLLIMLVGSDNGAAWQVPTDWNVLYLDYFSSADGANFNVLYKIASSEPTTYNINAVPFTNSAAGWIAAWRGVDPENPFDDKAHDNYYQTDAVTTKTLTAPSITLTTEDCLLVYIGYVDQNTTNSMVFDIPASYTIRGTQQAGNNWVTSAVGDRLASSLGPTGVVTTDWDNGRDNSVTTSGVGAIHLALRPKQDW